MTESNQAINKIAPEKNLSQQQKQIVADLFSFVSANLGKERHAVYVLEGDAGSGKSVVLSYFFNQLQLAVRKKTENLLSQTHNYFLVNHAEMLKVYKEIAGFEPALLKKDFDKPTPFINRLNKEKAIADVTIVDEAHLLLSAPDRFNQFNQQNQLTEILKRSRVTILVFDVDQVLKLKSFWDIGRLRQILKPFVVKKAVLTDQFRLQASPGTLNWINHFAKAREVLSLPLDHQFDFRLFTHAEPMFELIKKRNAEVGLSRMLATADYPYTLNGETYYIDEPGFRMPWDKNMDPTHPWAERPETINEVGSIYTIQGFDLNYAGIILGPSVGYDAKRNLIIPRPEYYQDQEAFKRRADIVDTKQLYRIKQQIIMNSVNVLLKRGMHGLYVYASNPELKQKFSKILEDKYSAN